MLSRSGAVRLSGSGRECIKWNDRLNIEVWRFLIFLMGLSFRRVRRNNRLDVREGWHRKSA